MAVRAAERELRSRGRVAFRWWWVEERLSCDGGWPRRRGVPCEQCRAAGGARHPWKWKRKEVRRTTVKKVEPQLRESVVLERPLYLAWLGGCPALGPLILNLTRHCTC